MDLQARVRAAQKVMRLEHWHIDVKRFPDDDLDGCSAQIFFTSDQNHATIKFGRFFDGETETEQTNTIYHELGHCHSRDLLEDVEALKAHVAPTAWVTIWEGIRRREELMIASITEVIAPLASKRRTK